MKYLILILSMFAFTAQADQLVIAPGDIVFVGNPPIYTRVYSAPDEKGNFVVYPPMKTFNVSQIVAVEWKNEGAYCDPKNPNMKC